MGGGNKESMSPGGWGASYAIGSKLAGEQMTAPSTKLWI